MSDRKKELTSETSSQKAANYREFIHQPEFKELINEAMIRLIHKQPDQPMLFLAEFFDSQSKCTKREKHFKAYEILKLASYFQPPFQSNLFKAYEIISQNTTSSKKGLQNSPGLTGSSFKELLLIICNKALPKLSVTALLNKIGCRPYEMVPFNVFKYGVTRCFIFLEYSNICVNLYKSLQNEEKVAKKNICLTIVSKLDETLNLSINKPDDSKAALMLEKSYRLKSDVIAADFLENNIQGNEIMHEEEFLKHICDVFLSKITPVT